MKKFGILAWPAYITKQGNPYNYLIYRNMEKNGYPVYEFDFSLKDIFRIGLSGKYRVLHMHWPTALLSHSTPLRIRIRLVLFAMFLRIIKLMDKQIVWTVHNLKGHDSRYPDLEERLNQILYKHVDVFISLNKLGVKIIKERVERPDRQYVDYIPHPHYKGYYPNEIDKKTSRLKLNIPDDKFVFLFLGQIRAYKNISGLVSAFRKLNDVNKFLLIAGVVHEDLENTLLNYIKESNEIILVDSFIADQELQLFFNSCDLVVTPYIDIFNSGSVFLNLSFGKPTLAPAIGIFPELQKDVGKELIKLYDGELKEQHLKDAKDELLLDRQLSSSAIIDISKFDPEKIAAETLNSYRIN